MASHPSAIAALAVTVLLAAPAAAQPPTMDELWPNDDGRSWSYDQHYESYDTNHLVVDNQIRIFFDGEVTAPNAITAQYLRQELLAGPAFALASVGSDPFMSRLWIARPDLRGRIEQMTACPEFAPPGKYAVLFNGEFAYRKTADEIAAWRCNLADTRSWLWLVSDLTIGNQFTLQLVPDLASDIFLHGTIAAIEPVTVPAGTYTGCVRVDYVVDYGTATCTDPSGNPAGTYRSETRGHLHYAPGVGPVEEGEAWVPFAEYTGTCAEPGQLDEVLARTTLQLHSPPVAVQPTSWGRLKTLYR